MIECARSAGRINGRDVPNVPVRSRCRGSQQQRSLRPDILLTCRYIIPAAHYFQALRVRRDRLSVDAQCRKLDHFELQAVCQGMIAVENDRRRDRRSNILPERQEKCEARGNAGQEAFARCR